MRAERVRVRGCLRARAVRLLSCARVHCVCVCVLACDMRVHCPSYASAAVRTGCGPIRTGRWSSWTGSIFGWSCFGASWCGLLTCESPPNTLAHLEAGRGQVCDAQRVCERACVRVCAWARARAHTRCERFDLVCVAHQRPGLGFRDEGLGFRVQRTNGLACVPQPQREKMVALAVCQSNQHHLVVFDQLKRPSFRLASAKSTTYKRIRGLLKQPAPRGVVRRSTFEFAVPNLNHRRLCANPS